MKKTVSRYSDALTFKNVAEVELQYPGAVLDAPELGSTWNISASVDPDQQCRDLVIADDFIALVVGVKAYINSVARPKVSLDVILAFSDDPGAIQAQANFVLPPTIRLLGQQALHVIGPRAYATCKRWAKDQPVYLADSNWTAELLTSELPDGSCLYLRFEGAEKVLHSLQAKGRLRHGQERPVAVEVKCWSAAETADLPSTDETGRSNTKDCDGPYPLLKGLLLQQGQDSKVIIEG